DPAGDDRRPIQPSRAEPSNASSEVRMNWLLSLSVTVARLPPSEAAADWAADHDEGSSST
ncbi:MAG: hypothetical protein ACK5QX_01860, partial [bacterium]